MREFNPHPVTQGGRPDLRYRIALEHCGYESPRFVARFCDDEFIGSSAFYSSAVALAVGHNARRNGAAVIVGIPA